MGFQSDKKQLRTSQIAHHTRREFHLWDLPQRQVFALLDEAYRKALVAPLIESFGEVSLSKLIHVRPPTFRRWASVDASDRLGKSRTGYIRLDVLFRLGKTTNAERFSPEEIETHVVALKGYGCSLPAYGTSFPIQEHTPMIRVLMHFMGDGALYPIPGSTMTSSYSNQNRKLRRGFVISLSAIFGDVSRCVREDLCSQSRLRVMVPKWIAYVIAHFYPDAEFGQMRSKLPGRLFSVPDELKVEAIRTLADDDGSVQELCIRFVSGTCALLEDTRQLILQLIRGDSELESPQKEVLERSVSTIRKQRNWYRLDLGFRMLEWYRHRIGFSHPDKIRELEFRIKAANRTAQLDALARDLLIFSGLLNGQRTAQEIAFAHLIREEYVHASLRYHLAYGRVIKCGKSLRRKKAAAKELVSNIEPGQRKQEEGLHAQNVAGTGLHEIQMVETGAVRGL